MDSCEKFIKENDLIKKGDIIGVGCSGGGDSLALLHYLSVNKDKFGIKVIAIHIDHKIRENSHNDYEFVENISKKLGIEFLGYSIDVPFLAEKSGQSLETEAREARYNIFKKLIIEGKVDKIALAHHKRDQAETILMHILRGSGLSGARGMEAKSKNNIIRPFLNTSKEELLEYLLENNLSFVEDSTNSDNDYSRNYLRNVVFKDILARWPNAIDSIVNFGKVAKEDDEFIYDEIKENFIRENGTIKIPLKIFDDKPSIISRVLFNAIKEFCINKDFERRHIDLVVSQAKKGNNGDKLNLPFGLTAIKEYNFITIYKEREKREFFARLEEGILKVPGFGEIKIEKVDKASFEENALFIDYDKLPQDAAWRFRKEGDEFTKFGGGKKKLKSYLIDKKIPLRKRDSLPLLASGNDILVIAGVEISDKVKVESTSKIIFKISFKYWNSIFFMIKYF